VLALLALFAAGTLRHQERLHVGEALARGETPPVPALTLAPFVAGHAGVRGSTGQPAQPVSLQALRGHPVVLNFWASWCEPCKEEAPQLEQVWRTYRDRGLIVLGVDTHDLETPAQAFIDRYKITYPNVRDPDGSTARAFGATGVPETFFVGADGRIHGKFPGEQVDPKAWSEAASGLLAGRAHVP
jgi:peroxiredoxin